MTSIRGQKIPLDDARRAELVGTLPPGVRGEWETFYAQLGAFKQDSGVVRRLGREPLRLGDLPGATGAALKALDLRLVRTAATFKAASTTPAVRPGLAESAWNASDFPDGGVELDTLFVGKGWGRQEPPLLVWLQPDENARLASDKGVGAGLGIGLGVFLPLVVGPILAQTVPAFAGWGALLSFFLGPYIIYRLWLRRARAQLRRLPPEEGGSAFVAASLATRGRPTMEASARWAAQDAGLPPPQVRAEHGSTPAGGSLDTIYDYGGVHGIAAASFTFWGIEFVQLKTGKLGDVKSHRRLKGLVLREARNAWRAAGAIDPPASPQSLDNVAAAPGWSVRSLPAEKAGFPPFVQADAEVPPGQDPFAVADRMDQALRAFHPRAAPVAALEAGARRWAELGNHLVVDLIPADEEKWRIRIQGSIMEEELASLLRVLGAATRQT